MSRQNEQDHILSIGHQADVLDSDLRKMTAAVNEVGEMTRVINQDREIYEAIREAGEMYRPIREQMENIAAQIPESIASIPESMLDRTLSRSQRSAFETAQRQFGAVAGALQDLERLTRHMPRRGW